MEFTKTSMKIIDSVIDYAKICKDNKLPDILPVIETHYVRMEIDNWFCGLTNMFRYFLCYMYDTTRLSDIQILSDDQELRRDSVINTLIKLPISSSCHAKRITYTSAPSPKLTYFSLANIKDLSGYVNDAPVCLVDYNTTVAISANLTTGAAIDHGTNHEFAKQFNRAEMSQEQNGEYMYDSGTISFIYQDNVPASTVIKTVSGMMMEAIQGIQDNLDTHLLMQINIPYLTIPRDRSGIIAYCLVKHIYQNNPGMLWSLKTKKNINVSELEFPQSTYQDAKVLVGKGTKDLLAQIAKIKA